MNKTEKRKERMERVRQMFLQKVSEEDMAKELKVSLSTIRSYISELGLKRRDRVVLSKKIIEMYSAGREMSEIVQVLEVSKPYINKVIRRHGLQTRRKFAVEKNLIDENTVFADNRVRIVTVIVGGKKYQDVTPLLVPR